MATTSKEKLDDLLRICKLVVQTWTDYRNGEEVHMWMAIKALENTIRTLEEDEKSSSSG